MSISKIAKKLDVSRNTIRKYVNSNKPPRYNKTKRGSILDPYKPYIKERLEKYDFSAVRILEEIREKGYTGKYTLVKDYCHTIKKGRKIQAV